jgi:hypothetical protein
MLAPLGGETGRLYYSFHVAFLWLDADDRLARIELTKPERHTKNAPLGSMCTTGATCIRPRSDKISSAVSESCVGEDGNAAQCESWALSANSVVEVNGQPIDCTAQ